MMDQQQSKLIPNLLETLPQSNQNHSQNETSIRPNSQTNLKPYSKLQPVIPQEQQQKEQLIDVIVQLVQNNNPLPILAVLDQINIYQKTKDGVPVFNLLMNKFLPVSDIFKNIDIKFQTDQDGRTPLHYAAEIDDVKAVQWLLNKGCLNVRDKFGNTPVMDAVRFGHKRSFLLLLNSQHFNQQLPHIAAQYNRVWQLKSMQALGLSIITKNINNKTPLQIAVQNYSYQAAQFLCKITPNYQISRLQQLTDSTAIINRIKQARKSSLKKYHSTFPLLYKILQILIIVCSVNFSTQLLQATNTVNYGFGIIVILQLGMWLLYLIKKPKQKSPQNILKLLHQPYFPNNLDHICPACFNRYQPQHQQHCDSCHACVKKFHKHTYMCINKYNQIFWYIQQFLTVYILYKIIQYFNAYMLKYNILLTDKVPITINSLYLSASQLNLIFIFMVYVIGMLFDKICVCAQLFGMAFMNRTYLQTIRTENYPHLYQVFKGKNGKFRTKQKRIFLEYGLCLGFCVGIKNILFYFF